MGNTFLFYIDESADEVAYTYVALVIPIDRWKEVFQRVREFRRNLRDQYGIYVYKELHAWKLVSGRGRPANRIIGKYDRVQIFKQTLRFISTILYVKLFAAYTEQKKKYLELFTRLCNRLNRFPEEENTYGIMICDEGKEEIMTKLMRKMKVLNPIPSMYGRWENGSYTKNIPPERIVEDPFFKKSSKSYFIQLADFCAYSLLRWKRPNRRAIKYNYAKSFEILLPIVEKRATKYNKYGIIEI